MQGREDPGGEQTTNVTMIKYHTNRQTTNVTMIRHKIPHEQRYSFCHIGVMIKVMDDMIEHS